MNYEQSLVMASNLSQRYIGIFTKLIEEVYDYREEPGRLSKLHDSIIEIKTLERELSNSKLTDKQIYLLIYNSVRHIFLSNYVYDYELIRDFISNPVFRREIDKIKNPTLRITTYLYKLSPLLEDLYDSYDQRHYLEGLQIVNEITNMAHLGGVDKNLLKEGRETDLGATLKRFFTKYTFHSVPEKYKDFIKEREVKTSKNNHTYVETNTYEGRYTQAILRSYLKEKYPHSNSDYILYDKNTNIYKIEGKYIIAYKYDDTPDMYLIGNENYNFNDPEFWSLIFSDKVDFITSNVANYINEESLEVFKVIPNAYNYERFSKLNDFIIAPEKDLEAAYLLNSTDNKEEYTLLGVGRNLLTGDNIFYFNDPENIDALNISDLTKFKYINLLKSKTGIDRKRSIAGIKAGVTRKEKK